MNEPLDPGPIETRQHWQIVADLTRERDEAREERDELLNFLEWTAHCIGFEGNLPPQTGKEGA